MTLRRRVPLARGESRLKRTRLRRQSERRRSERDQRDECRERVWRRDRTCRAEHIWPEVRCAGPLDVHEVLARSAGGDPLDPDGCVLLCRAHHLQVDLQSTKAKQLGLKRSWWDRVGYTLGVDTQPGNDV